MPLLAPQIFHVAALGRFATCATIVMPGPKFLTEHTYTTSAWFGAAAVLLEAQHHLGHCLHHKHTNNTMHGSVAAVLGSAAHKHPHRRTSHFFGKLPSNVPSRTPHMVTTNLKIK